MSGATKRLYPVAGALLRQYGGEGSFLPIGEVHPREFADMAGTPSWSRPQDSR